jgi:hypothetical protein
MMIVLMMAITPSLNASSRSLVMTSLCPFCNPIVRLQAISRSARAYGPQHFCGHDRRHRRRQYIEGALPMKKLIALILVTLLCGPAMAGTVDWSSVTDDEINAEIAAEQAGLA